MKRDDDPWQLDRLSAAEAPELCRAVDAAKRQLPSGRELAALAASLPLAGSPLPNAQRLGKALRAAARARAHWLVIGAAALAAVVLSVKRAGPPAAGSERAAPRSAVAASDSGLPSPGAAVASTRQPAVPLGKTGIAERAERAPPVAELAVPEGQARAPGAPLAVSSALPAAATANEPTPARVPSAATISAVRSAEVARQSPLPAAAQGSNLEPGSKAQPTEIELLRDARLALRSSPALALGLTEQHSALYPRGAMAQERELIAISALARLGRHAAVLSRAQRFEHDFPNSPYRKQIAQMAE